MNRSELDAFLDAGVAMLGASADEDHRPEAFRVWGATLDTEGRLRALVSSDAGRTMAGMAHGTRISFSFTDITTFRSVQAKGSAIGPAGAPGPDDLRVLRRYDERFTAKLREIGHPDRLGDRIRPGAVFVVSVEIDDLYDQTPGPHAGARVAADLS